MCAFVALYSLNPNVLHIFIQVKSKSTLPIYYGKVIRFLLFGEHDKDVFATGGDVEIALVRTLLVCI